MKSSSHSAPKPLSTLVNEEVNAALRTELKASRYHGISFEQAMAFFLTDGVLPASSAPVSGFLALEDWLRGQVSARGVVYTASDLKNKTGEILEQVLRGKTVRILKHGREIAHLIPT